MRPRSLLAGAVVSGLLLASPVLAEPLFWGFRAERLEYRLGEDTDGLTWDFDASVGSDALRVVWRSEADYLTDEDGFEKLENQGRLQTPISDFFDAVAGVMVSTPDGPNRAYGLIGVHGLAPQWFEIDADLFVSNNPFFRLEVDYEGLITNRIILTPSIELELPLTDDEAIGAGAWGPKLELGARLSYDLIDRTVSPYIGLHYERLFGQSADLARDEDEDRADLFFVVGTRVMF